MIDQFIYIIATIADGQIYMYIDFNYICMRVSDRTPYKVLITASHLLDIHFPIRYLPETMLECCLWKGFRECLANVFPISNKSTINWLIQLMTYFKARKSLTLSFVYHRNISWTIFVFLIKIIKMWPHHCVIKATLCWIPETNYPQIASILLVNWYRTINILLNSDDDLIRFTNQDEDDINRIAKYQTL